MQYGLIYASYFARSKGKLQLFINAEPGTFLLGFACLLLKRLWFLFTR
jgi:hypothetical protein